MNIQTNSGNRGYNLFKKFSKANLLFLDEPEIRLGMSSRYKSLEWIMKSRELKNYKDLIITRGIKGLMIKDKNSKSGFYNFPALNTEVVDTMGAGDAAFAYACMFINSTDNKLLVGLLSSIAGAIKTTIIGHEKFVRKIRSIKKLGNNNKEMKILVTGGAGFIGSHLCETLLKKKRN